MPERDLARRLAVYLLADPEHTVRNLVADVAAALAGGVAAVQLRAKRLSDRETLALARAMIEPCRQHGALFLLNDRVDLALAAGADGVHLGVDDLPLADARRLLPPGAVIGYSPDTDDQAASAGDAGADYLGIGPCFETTTKLDAGAAIGPEGFGRRARLSGLPCIGIGGITAGNAAQVIEAGAVGVAVTSAILRASDPEHAAHALADVVHQSLAGREDVGSMAIGK
jgi:thiamine-phosphate diphosphorylase